MSRALWHTASVLKEFSFVQRVKIACPCHHLFTCFPVEGHNLFIILFIYFILLSFMAHSSHLTLLEKLQLWTVWSMSLVHLTTPRPTARQKHWCRNKGVKAEKSSRILQHKLDRFLLAYRSAPHATTAQLLLDRNVKTRMDLIKPTRYCSSPITAPWNLLTTTRMYGAATTAEDQNGCVAHSLSEQGQSWTKSR